MEKAFVYGAGSVGRGFLGQLFSESGYQVTFVDVIGPLIEALRRRGAYTIRLVDGDNVEEVTVGPVTGLLAEEQDAVAEAVAQASLGATAVGARVLPRIAPAVAEGIRLRLERQVGEPLNIIVCENLKDAASIFRGMVCEHLSPETVEYLDEHVGFVETVIGRMVPELPRELAEREPSLIVAEPYKELPVDRAAFVGAIPEVVGMQAVSDFAVYTARKLYLHNAGHAILGYLGYKKGLTLGYEALEDADIRPILDGALDESVRGIAAHYGTEESWLREHVADLLRRFANRALADPVKRLARDPLRKLAPEDRLVGAARVARYGGIVPVNLAWGIAGALAYDEPTDSMAVRLQEQIAAQGVARVLGSVCEIAPSEGLGVAVLTRYDMLMGENPWQ